MVRLAGQLPLPTLIERGTAFGKRKISGCIARRRDARRATFAPDQAPNPFTLYYRVPESAVLCKQADAIRGLSTQFLAHRFDLLGSGWGRVVPGMRCHGLEGHRYEDRTAPPDQTVNAANRAESNRIRGLIDCNYAAIDWHIDFKSGYRWPKGQWYRDIPYGHRPGVDIKVPWELARMQHLPTLAFAHALARDGVEGFEPHDRYAREFRNQILDFIADNPPRFGVNWRCTMDVAIRIANWLAARDLLRSAGAEFDAGFEAVFARSVLEHGRHIAANLEWDPQYRANHYLADIVGLLYVAAYLPRSAETDAWLGLAVRELIAEVDRQFLPDGGNFEGSTPYHRLSAEMALHATALVLALPPEKQAALPGYPLPSSHLDRLAHAAHFTAAVAKPSGRIAQIGDNDSGRFLKFSPPVLRRSVAEAKERYASLAGYGELSDDADYWDEDHLDTRPLLAAFAGLFTGLESPFDLDRFDIETNIVGALSGSRHWPASIVAGRVHAAVSIPGIPPGHVLLDVEIRVPGEGLLDGLAAQAFPDFGLYVWRSGRLFLAVRCGPIGQNGRGGHAHNDQLSVELTVDGEDWIADPGTYLYTPLPERRNAYRSVQAHFAPRLKDKEPGRLDLGPFWLGNEAKAQCMAFDPEGFLGFHQGFGPRVFRRVAVSEGNIRITDVVEGQPEEMPDRIVLTGGKAVRAALQPDITFSPGYGILMNGPVAG